MNRIKNKSKTPTLWRKVEDEHVPQRCDLCSGKIVWMHPAGGFRCRRCPRPDK
jgi:hypothetical protein